MPRQTLNGKAFEYACLKAVYDVLLSKNKQTEINNTAAFETAKNAFYTLDEETQSRYLLAAQTAAKTICGLEPRLVNGEGSLVFEIEPDSVAIGVDGDVRDVLFTRVSVHDQKWEIGVSCKHNHEALKHPRITEGKDFSWDWIGIHCSQEFMEEITPITDSLVSFGNEGKQWKTISNKYDSYYVPILKAYLKEIKRLCDQYDRVSEMLLSYFFGAKDFYKIIMKESAKTTTIEGFNMHGTLNKPNGSERAFTKVPIIKMPTRLINADFKLVRQGQSQSKTTIILVFDQGWSVSMRLHNKDKVAKPTSLAWDVTLVGLPTSTYVNTRSWFE